MQDNLPPLRAPSSASLLLRQRRQAIGTCCRRRLPQKCPRPVAGSRDTSVSLKAFLAELMAATLFVFFGRAADAGRRGGRTIGGGGKPFDPAPPPPRSSRRHEAGSTVSSAPQAPLLPAGWAPASRCSLQLSCSTNFELSSRTPPRVHLHLQSGSCPTYRRSRLASETPSETLITAAARLTPRHTNTHGHTDTQWSLFRSQELATRAGGPPWCRAGTTGCAGGAVLPLRACKPAPARADIRAPARLQPAPAAAACRHVWSSQWQCLPVERQQQCLRLPPR